MEDGANVGDGADDGEGGDGSGDANGDGSGGDGNDLLRSAARQVALTKRLRARIQELEYERAAPLAVVSTALRLPGGLTTPDAYWQFLLGDRDVISHLPEDRPRLREVYDPRPDAPNRSYADKAAFVADVAGFDPEFFGMSQHEAERTDPQQRLLLETAWETMERAGIAVRRRDRLSAGVFIGIPADEYSPRLDHGDRRHDQDAAARISNTMGLTGPSISLHAADSSSLVALHLAVQALRHDECRYALVGGVNLMLSPDPMISLSRSRSLAPDGRCKPFTAAADGHGRGEGVGIVLLMRLRDAEQEGRPIQAVLRGSAVLHSGTSNAVASQRSGTPDHISGHEAEAVRTTLVDACRAQQNVIRAALSDAGVAAHEVGVVEAHAVGSALGDPIEIGALDEVIGTAAPQRPVRALVGTLKPRLGHLGGAAGIAALIKVVLMLQHGIVPAAVPLEAGPLTDFVPWDRVRLLVPRVHTPWPIEYKRRIAGVSSFGANGTNAHAVLEAYAPTPTAPPVAPPPPATTEPASLRTQPHQRPHLITLSARNATSLTEMVVATSSYLVGTPPEKLASVAYTLHTGRTPFEHRVAVVGTSASDLAEKLAVAVGHSSRIGGKASAVIVHVGSGVVRLSAAINALTATYPLLAPVVGATDLPPAERLKRLMQDFGLRVKSERRAPASGAAAAEIAWTDRRLPLITDDAEATPAHLLHILAALFVDGADLCLDALRQPGARIVDDLPTYSFRRKRCWIDEHADVQPNAAEHDHDHELVRDFLLNELINVVPPGKVLNLTETFIELGGDSFAAMQLTVGIEERYGVEIPLEEFNGDLQISVLIDRLARRIAREYVPATGVHSGDLATDRI